MYRKRESELHSPITQRHTHTQTASSNREQFSSTTLPFNYKYIYSLYTFFPPPLLLRLLSLSPQAFYKQQFLSHSGSGRYVTLPLLFSNRSRCWCVFNNIIHNMPFALHFTFFFFLHTSTSLSHTHMHAPLLINQLRRHWIIESLCLRARFYNSWRVSLSLLRTFTLFACMRACLVSKNTKIKWFFNTKYKIISFFNQKYQKIYFSIRKLRKNHPFLLLVQITLWPTCTVLNVELQSPSKKHECIYKRLHTRTRSECNCACAIYNVFRPVTSLFFPLFEFTCVRSLCISFACSLINKWFTEIFGLLPFDVEEEEERESEKCVWWHKSEWMLLVLFIWEKCWLCLLWGMKERYPGEHFYHIIMFIWILWYLQDS